jgi:hypothetical protein
MRPLLPLLFLLALAAGLSACAATEEGARPRSAPPTAGTSGFTPSAVDARVQTVQLHTSGRESALPAITLGSGQTLTLSFDLLDDAVGGPVSVAFYHADRHWNRRLLPVEFLRGFQTDDIRTYEPSVGTRVRYTHYTYRFPNPTIEFTRSGNFIVRVTELGDERAVLFERPFFITEGSAEVDLSLQSGIGAGLGGPFLQPVARVRPPSRFDSPLYDFDVCFARDGRFDLVRCTGEPSLLGAAMYQFFLPRERAFGPPAPRYALDLSILGAGPQIASVDLTARPPRITLAPDDARFSTAFFDEGLLAGQSLVVSVVQDAPDPSRQAEYAEVTFRYVPPGRERVAGRVVLSGSFNGWALDPAFALRWNAEEGVYETTALVKQGRHTYTYYVEDPVEQERRRRELDLGRPTLYTALVYLRDPALNTDRLVAVQNLMGQ